MIKRLIKRILRSLGLNKFINIIYEFQNKFMNFKNKNLEKENLIFYNKILDKNKNLIFDIGANVGDYTDIYLKLNTKKIISIEPQKEVFKKLSKRFKNNKKVECLQYGVGSKKEKLEMFISDEANKLSTFSKKQVKKSRFSKDFVWNKKYIVKILTLNDLIKIYGKPNFIKIDVEGFEEEVLKGLSTTINLIQFEFIIENLNSTINCIKIIEKFGDYEFNIAGTSINSNFILKKFVNSSFLINFIKTINVKDFGGDIYARLKNEQK